MIGRGAFQSALFPGIRLHWGRGYNPQAMMYDKVLTRTKDSTQAYEDDQQSLGFGLVPEKGEGAPLQYATNSEGLLKRYVWTSFALGFTVSRDLDNNCQFKPCPSVAPSPTPTTLPTPSPSPSPSPTLSPSPSPSLCRLRKCILGVLPQYRKWCRSPPRDSAWTGWHWRTSRTPARVAVRPRIIGPLTTLAQLLMSTCRRQRLTSWKRTWATGLTTRVSPSRRR